METILKSIDAMVVCHNIMMDFNGNEFHKDIDLDNASTLTDIDDDNRVPCPHERFVLGMTFDDDNAPATRRKQLLRLVEEHYIRPVWKSCFH